MRGRNIELKEKREVKQKGERACWGGKERASREKKGEQKKNL